MSKESSRTVCLSLQQPQPWRQLEVANRDGDNGVDSATPLLNPSDTSAILFTTPVEQKFWEQLVGILSPSLWKVKACGGIQRGSGVILFSGSPETVPRAKEAISKLLIMVGSGIRVHLHNLLQSAGFFHLCEGLDFFLWEGETSRFRVDAVLRFNSQESMDCGNAVFARRVLDHQGSLHTNLDIHLLYPTTVELAIGAVKLALEAASKKGHRSLVVSCSDHSFSPADAEAVAIGLDIFKKGHLASPLRSIHFVCSGGRALARVRKECEKRWALGKKDQVWLRNLLLSLGTAKVEVAASSSTVKKTDVAVIPLGLDSDLLEWGPEVVAITQKVLEAIPHAANLLPGEILPVTAAAVPEFASRTVYLIRLEGSRLQPKDGHEAIRKMVWSCLSDVYGSFLESISFPLIRPAGPDKDANGKWLLVMLEEINRFLKELPNTWMKLVQVVPFPGQTLQCQVEDYLTNTLEPVGLCYLEEPLFLTYLKENSDALDDFEVELKKVGYTIQIYSPWRMLTFQATSQPGRLHDLLAAFQSTREKYILNCESRTEVLEASCEVQALVKTFRSIRIYTNEKIWSVGQREEMASFLQHLNQMASQRQLVSWERSAEPLLRCAIVRGFLVQELLLLNSLVKIEILTKTPAMVRFSGRRQNVEEAERRFRELLHGFRVAPVPLTVLQSQFIKLRWGKFFYSNFFLERHLPAVLEISEDVQVAGLDLDVMKKAEELLLREVCERTVEIAAEVKWSTEREEWRSLLQRLRSQDEVALHHTTFSQVCVVGLHPHVAQVEESIKEYLRDNSPVEEKMSLVKPELTLVGEGLLCIMDWRHLKVNVRLQPNGQVSELQVSGLRKHVREAVPVIGMDLNDLVSDTIPVRNKALREYFSGVGASLLKDMGQGLQCIARMQKSKSCVGSLEQRFDKSHSGVIYAIGKRNHVVSLKQAMADFIARFCEESICSEAIGTFSDQMLSKLCRSTPHKFPVSLHPLKMNELQVRGSQEDVANILEAVHAEIAKYHTEPIVVKAQYQKVPYVIVKAYLNREMLPTDPLVNTKILAENPVAVIFSGPRQKVKQLQRCFEERFDGYQVLSVHLSDLQSQFIKAQWDKLFGNTFFLEQGVLAVLEISDVVQVAGFDLDVMEEAEKLFLGHVRDETMEIPEEVKWATECEEWRELLDRLESQDEVTLNLTSSGQVTVVGICSYVTQVVASIHEYFEDNSSVEENVIINRSELALAGEKILHIMDWNDLEVNIQILPNNQALSLQVSGIQKFVREAIQVIKEDIDLLMFVTVLVKKVALGGYFSGTGASVLQEMAQEKGCIAWIQHQKSLGLWYGVSSSNGSDRQELAEDHWGLICIVGTENDIEAFKEDVNYFAAAFHEEIICNAEISAFRNDMLAEICKETPHQFPVVACYLREKVVRVCGYREDVENILGAIYAKIEEVSLAKLQESQAQWIESKLLYETVRWHHMTDVGWSTFDMNTNWSLETAYSQKMFKTQVLWDGQKLEVSLLKSQAFIPDTGRTFRIRREICLWEKSFAPHWDAMDGCLVKKVELQANSEEYQDIVKNFLQTANDYTVLKVERIQNQYLWVSYCWKRSCMEKKNPEGLQNERILYHGTQPDNQHSIREIGFKSACRKEGLYGQGIYFSVTASRAIFYAKPDPQGHRYIFQARVLTGEFVRGDEKMVLPPKKQEGSGCYDSLVDIPKKPTLFVTSFDDHAYPEYLITVCGPMS